MEFLLKKLNISYAHNKSSKENQYNDFLIGYFIGTLLNSKFKTKIIILGRDRLTQTSEFWNMKYQKYIKEIHSERFSNDESEEYLKMNKITDKNQISKIIEETQGVPYLLELYSKNANGFSALNLRLFFERTTAWMNKEQKNWFIHLSFLDNINIPNIRKILPNEDANEIYIWFEKESSIRDPNYKEWRVLPFISSKIKDYLYNKDPEEFEKYQNIAKNIKLNKVK